VPGLNDEQQYRAALNGIPELFERLVYNLNRYNRGERGSVVEEAIREYSLGVADRCQRIAMYVDCDGSRKRITDYLTFIAIQYGIEFPSIHSFSTLKRNAGSGPIADDPAASMSALFKQIEDGLSANLYYLSLFVSLCLPDICAAMSSSNGEASGQTYIAWFDSYVAPRCHGKLDGETCYRFRCSLLHQGTTLHPKSRYKRILFIEPQSGKVVVHLGDSSGGLMIDAPSFCQDVIRGAYDWLRENQNAPEFLTNFPKFVHRYPTGLLPFVFGLPVIS